MTTGFTDDKRMPQTGGSIVEILNCIDRGLETFGQNVGKVVYYRMSKESGIHRSQIIANPNLFISCIGNMFGTYGVKVEKVVGDEIKRKFPAARGNSLLEIINDAKRLVYSSREY